MKWKAEYSVGIETIDSQHKQIFSHLLAIENSLEKKDPWHVMRFLFVQLAEYMKFHFAVEEAILEIVRYPQLRDHTASHARLGEQLAELEEKVKGAGSGANLVSFFENWFIGHVLTSDRQYAAYVKEQFPAIFDA